MLAEIIQVSIATIIIIGLLGVILGLVIGIRLAIPNYLP